LVKAAVGFLLVLESKPTIEDEKENEDDSAFVKFVDKKSFPPLLNAKME
jgi:hypothetical protein